MPSAGPDEGPPTGEPDAGDPLVRFGGGGRRLIPASPYPYRRPAGQGRGVVWAPEKAGSCRRRDRLRQGDSNLVTEAAAGATWRYVEDGFGEARRTGGGSGQSATRHLGAGRRLPRRGPMRKSPIRWATHMTLTRRLFARALGRLGASGQRLGERDGRDSLEPGERCGILGHGLRLRASGRPGARYLVPAPGRTRWPGLS